MRTVGSYASLSVCSLDLTKKGENIKGKEMLSMAGEDESRVILRETYRQTDTTSER